MTSNIKNILLYSKLFKYPRRILKYSLSGLYPVVTSIWKLPDTKSIEETIICLSENNYSIARFGDGEILYLVNRMDLAFQKYDDRLAEFMREILKNKTKNLIVGLPDGFRDVSGYENEIKIFWKSQISYNYPRFYKFLDLKSQYWNANITRLYYGYKDQTKSGRYFDMMRSLWKDREILLIEGEKSRLGMGNDLFAPAIGVERILGPAHHAFSQFDNILNEVMTHSKSKLLLIAMGPAAKALTYVLTNEGYHCLDVGNLDIEYEWYKKKVTERTRVKGKYTSEVVGGREVEDGGDSTYKQQIVAQFIN
jgi:glycosyltransferase family protein